MAWKTAVLAAALLAAACSKTALSDGPGGMTPEECFAKVEDARARFEWRALQDHYAPESHGRLLAAAVVPWAEARRGARAAKKPEPEDVHFVEGILRERGVSLDAVVRALDGGPGAVEKLFESVIDRRGLFVAVMVQTAGTPGYRRPEMVRLEDVVVDGESARGRGVFLAGGAETKQDQRFRRIGGRWFMVLGEDR